VNFGKIDVRGKKIDVDIDGGGSFSAEYNGQEINAPTLTSLKEKLDRVVKNDKIKPIPFIQWDGEKLRRGKCTGIHGGNNNLIVVYEDEKGFQQPWRLDNAIDPKHTAEYGELCSAVVVAEEARYAFEKKHAFEMKERVEEAIAALAKESDK
jgi:hypothetical protein